MLQSITQKIMEFTELDQYPAAHRGAAGHEAAVPELSQEDTALAQEVSSGLLAVATQQERETLAKLMHSTDEHVTEQLGVDREMTIQLFLFQLMKRARLTHV